MPLLSESRDVLPIHRRILAFSFIGWIFDFYDLLLLSFLVSSTTLTKDLALSRDEVSVLLGTALAFTAARCPSRTSGSKPSRAASFVVSATPPRSARCSAPRSARRLRSR